MDFADGFCRRREGAVIAAFNSTAYRADSEAKASKSSAISKVKAFPELPDGTRKMILRQDFVSL